MADEAFVVARGIGKRFGGVRALTDVGIAIGRGEVVALAGENGSGKSTLARILAGALHADAGEIVVEGRSCSFVRPKDALDAGIALVTQELTAVPHMSVAENVLLPALNRWHGRFKRSDLATRSRPYLDAVGLRVDPLQPFVTLRSGDRELAEVAKALASDPRLLILDEASARLPDPERLFALVDRLRADGISAIFITHRLPEIRRLADRAVVLRDGRVVGELARSELSDERLSAMMVGRELSKLADKPVATPADIVLEVEGLVAGPSKPPVSLRVRQGEVVGLAGLVGAGRSSLLETIAGFRQSRGGRVLVGAVPVPDNSPKKALRVRLSLLPEDRRRLGLVLGASIRENIAMATWRPFTVSKRGRERSNALAAVEQLRIRCAGVEAPVRTLSGGNQQKVVIARCLSIAPRVLLLDEPTCGVDVGARDELYRIIREMVSEGMAVLLASSDLRELLTLSDRILVMREGALVAELDRTQATEERIALLSAGGTESHSVA